MPVLDDREVEIWWKKRRLLGKAEREVRSVLVLVLFNNTETWGKVSVKLELKLPCLVPPSPSTSTLIKPHNHSPYSQL